MFAMWRVGRFGRVLLAIFLMSAIACPAAWASPDGESIQQYGQPPVWGSCQRWIGDVRNIEAIPTAVCGTVSVPVDYAKPEGAQAQLAVIRIPASGEKIGVLVVNPGGPGASAVDTVASMGASLAGTDILRRFDLVGIDPRGVGHSTPELRCRTDAEFDAFRREPMADYSPEGVAHIEALNGQFADECAQRMGTEFLANIGTASSARDMDVVRAALGENQINYLGFSYGTELGAAYAERYPDRVRAMVLDGAVDPSLDPVAESIRQMAGFQTAFNDYAADCAQSAGCPLGTDPAKFVDRFHELVDPLVNKPGADVGSAWPELPGRDHRHRQRALHAALLAVPDQRAAGPAARHRRRRPAVCWPTTTSTATSRATTTTCRTRSPRSAASTRRTRPTRRCGPTPIGKSARPRRSWRTAPSPGYAPRDVCAMWPVPPTSTPASRHLAGSRQGRRRLHHARSRHAVSGRRRSGPSDGRRADHVRRHPAHGGVQRRPMCRHRGGQLPHRFRRAARRSALLAAKRIGRVTQN